MRGANSLTTGPRLKEKRILEVAVTESTQETLTRYEARLAAGTEMEYSGISHYLWDRAMGESLRSSIAKDLAG